MDDIAKLLLGGWSAYALTFVFTMSYIARPIRERIAKMRAQWSLGYPWEECRQCVGFWASLLAWAFTWPSGPLMLLGIYGFSYFLACREIPIPPSNLDDNG